MPSLAPLPDDSDAPEVSVVIPLYNEEENVVILLEELQRVLTGVSHEIVFVDDGSTDRTVERITLGPGVRVVRFRRNAGQSAAMYAGLHAAKGRMVALMDGDLQNDPSDIPALLAEVRAGADLVCGYRKRRRDTFFKRIQSRIANGVRSRFIGDGVRDTGCSLKAMRRECVGALVLFRGMHRFIPALVKGAGFTVREIAVNHRARRFGVSKYGFANRAWRATMDMFGVRWLLSRRVTYEAVEGE